MKLKPPAETFDFKRKFTRASSGKLWTQIRRGAFDNEEGEQMALKEKEKGLISFTSPESIISEQYRTIRTNIHFSSVDHKVPHVGYHFPRLWRRKVNDGYQSSYLYGTARGKSISH